MEWSSAKWYTARFESLSVPPACGARVVQKEPEARRCFAAMCEVIRRGFGNLSPHQSLEGNGTTQGHTLNIYNQQMAAARSDPQARKTWAAAGLVVADRNKALAEWRKAATRTEGAAMRMTTEKQVP